MVFFFQNSFQDIFKMSGFLYKHPVTIQVKWKQENINFPFFYGVFLNKLHFILTVELKASQTDSSKSYVVE